MGNKFLGERWMYARYHIPISLYTCFLASTLFLSGCFYDLSFPIDDGQTDSTLHVANWAYQLQDADPDEIAHAGFQLVVIDYSRDGSTAGEYTAAEIQRLRDAGVIPLAYLSIGEAEDYRFYWQPQWDTNPPVWLGKENPEWEGNYPVHYWHPEWKSILHRYLDKIIEQGFAGVYLDRIDSFEYWSDPHNGEDTLLSEQAAATQMIALITELARYVRSKVAIPFYIIPQNGERILAYDTDSLLSLVSGWAAEDLFYNGLHRWDTDDSLWIASYRLPFLDHIRNWGKPILSVDYVDDGSGYSGQNRHRIDDYRQRAQAKGYIPYVAIADRELDELNLIPGIQP